MAYMYMYHAQPHTWQRNSDTHFELAHFKKDKKKKGDKSGVTNHISHGLPYKNNISGYSVGTCSFHSLSLSPLKFDPTTLIGLATMYTYICT